MKTAGKMFCFVVLLVFCVMGQISIGYEDAVEWDSRWYIGMNPVSAINQVYPQLNTEFPVGENVIWDFSQYPVEEIDTTIEKEDDDIYFWSYVYKHKIWDKNEIDNSNGVLDLDTIDISKAEGSDDEGDAYNYYYILNNECKVEVGVCGIGNPGDTVTGIYPSSEYDTVLVFELEYNDQFKQIISKLPDEIRENEVDSTRDSIVKYVNAYGNLILPGGAEIEVIGVRELNFHKTYNKNGKINCSISIYYWLYSKEYGVVCRLSASLVNIEIVIFNDTSDINDTCNYPDIPDSLILDKGNIYDIKDFKTIEIYIPDSLNSQGSTNHNFPSKTYALSEITDKTYYDLMGRKLSVKDQIDNGYSGVVILKGGRKGRVLKKLMVGENR